jgi:ubiquinone biosynthesis protein
VMADGRTALLDFGITGRMDEVKRLALLRLMMAGSANDIRSQLAAMRDLGALPADADLDAVARELRLDQPPVDPTTMTGEQLVGEMQEIVKAMLGIGARLPKELMLFIKNMVFLDSAIATLAPDLDLFGEIANISIYFATRHGDRIAADIGIDPRSIELDMTGVKASFGLEADAEGLTHRQLQARRETIRRNLSDRRRPRR